MRPATDHDPNRLATIGTRNPSRTARSTTACTAVWVVVIALTCSACGGLVRAMRRSGYDYEWERTKCNTLLDDEERNLCLDDLRTTEEKAIEPTGYIAARADERRRAKKEHERQTEERERTARIRARCSSASDLIHASFAKRAYTQAYKIAEESDGECSERDAINATLLSEVRKLSPQEVASSRSAAIARLYWRPIEIRDWLTAAGRGELISTNGVHIAGTVEQQFDDRVVIEVSETVRVVLRLDRKRFFQTSDMVYVIGRFVEMGRFTTVLGVRIDMPVFDVVYWLG